MLAGKDDAKVSSDHRGCTTTPRYYDIQKENKTYRLWDTCGLNEGVAGSVPAEEAIESLVNQVKDISVSLIIYCVRGNRFPDIVRRNYKVFCRDICQGKVRTVLVVTGLEQEEDIDGWWKTNEKDVKQLNLAFAGHACVTTFKGKKNEYKEEYDLSADKVWRLVKASCDPAPWTMPREWYNSLIEKAKRVFGRNRKHGDRYGPSFIEIHEFTLSLVKSHPSKFRRM